jgi:hypothetical protein
MFDSPVSYNGFNLNTITANSAGIRRGSVLEVFDFSRSQGVGYLEKRAQDDGMDASDVYMGPRYISLAGTIFGEDEADLHDLVQELRTALTPTAAYVFDKWDHGFIPLEFALRTKDSRFPIHPAGDFERLVEFRARPVGQPTLQFRRDGGANAGAGQDFGMAATWTAQLECKDPRLYVRPDTWLYWNTAVTGVTILNRGDYPAPLDILLVINSAPADSRVEIDVGGSNVTIKTGGLAVDTIVRYSGTLKVLTVDNAAGGTFDVLRMDLFALRNNTTHPKVNPSNDAIYPGAGKFSTRLYNGLTLKSTTRFMYSESFA